LLRGHALKAPPQPAFQLPQDREGKPSTPTVTTEPSKSPETWKRTFAAVEMQYSARPVKERLNFVETLHPALSQEAAFEPITTDEHDPVGADVGRSDGEGDGLDVGTNVGADEGGAVGTAVGTSGVGSAHCSASASAPSAGHGRSNVVRL